MDLNFPRRKRERAIAAEIVNELYTALEPAMDAGVADPANFLLGENRPLVTHVFATACEKHGLDEAAATRVLHYLPAVAGDLERQFADLNRQVEAATEHFESQRGRL